MPPKKNIIKSGNTGNSSKANKLSRSSTQVIEAVEKPLFPPGSKFPLSLLHERCQKNGWEKPVVDTRQQDGGWSFVVTLSRFDKKTSQKETVRLEPHPPYVRPTILEARHWGATYALYRFCNGIQLNLVLPLGPRDYWNELAAEHKIIPEHMAWMYDADPFTARREVNERQARASQKKQQTATGNTEIHRNTSDSSEFRQGLEVKMASSLRELIEDTIKKAMLLYPEAENASPPVLPEASAWEITQQLGHLGFTTAQTRNAVSFLSQPSPVTSNLLGSLSALEAAIEYLILYVPECDMPDRFLPAHNSSSPFIASVHSGVDDVKKRWVEDKAIKEAGWPAHVVRQCTSDPRLVNRWDLLISALNKRLVGGDWNEVFEPPLEDLKPYKVVPEEIEALGAHFSNQTELVMPLFSAPVKLHILVSDEDRDLRRDRTPMYITSVSAPAYVRLHLLARLLQAMKDDDGFAESGEGFCMAAMRFLEGEWAGIEDNGPPDMSSVLEHLVPSRKTDPRPTDGQNLDYSLSTNANRRETSTRRFRDARNDKQIRQDFEAIRRLDKYTELFKARKELPAFSAADNFLKQLAKSRVVIVAGETGCGKTTQLPQFILDSLILSDTGSKTSIIVTQPRRISAISVAARVSSERLDDGSVGYAIRGESKQSTKTKLLFCTTGVVLRRLGSGDSLDSVSHIIVDEVHERSLDGDFLLLELKELMKRNSRLKIVLMSATINHESFVRYFDGAPLLTIPGFTHPVTDLYLEDLIPLINYHPPPGRSTRKENDEKRTFRDELKSRGLDDHSVSAIENISSSDHIDFQLITAILKHIVSTEQKRGGILIFLPGIQDIRQCIDTIKGVFMTNQVDVLPLHANLSNDEQRRAFSKTSKWKIIAATNVAETSITIDDVIYVIDAGKMKETQYDPETGLSRLVETWVTRAAAKQRRGRAGRTQPGVCYKLYTKKQEDRMTQFPVPEILRVPLENISLAVKAMREDEDVKMYLSRAIDPPKVDVIDKAWSVLQELGAVDQDGKLTALGRHISMIPVDLRLGKMLVLGTIFRCLDPILTIAACLSSKPLFVSPIEKQDESTRARARFITSESDLLTDLKAYDECIRLRTEGKLGRNIRSFYEQNFISSTTVREVTTLRHDFISILSDIGFIPFSSTSSAPSLNTNSKNTNLLKSVILGGLWPRVARVHLPRSAIKFDKIQAGTVQRENTAREFKMYDLEDKRVFLHPASVLFGTATWKSAFLVYFHKYMSSKVFLRDATQVPLYALLLFGGSVTVNHIAGGLTIGTKENCIKLKAWPRIGVLVNQLRRLLDAQLQQCIEGGTTLHAGPESPVLNVMLSLLEHDGLSE